MPRFHLGFPSPSIADLKMPDNAALARLAETLGFDTLWHSNQRFYREMFVRMASSAMVTGWTSGPMAMSDPTRSLVVTAAAAAAMVSGRGTQASSTK